MCDSIFEIILQTPNIAKAIFPNFKIVGKLIQDSEAWGTEVRFMMGGTGYRSWGNRRLALGEPLGWATRRHSFVEKVRIPTGRPGWGKRDPLAPTNREKLETCFSVILFFCSIRRFRSFWRDRTLFHGRFKPFFAETYSASKKKRVSSLLSHRI